MIKKKNTNKSQISRSNHKALLNNFEQDSTPIKLSIFTTIIILKL